MEKLYKYLQARRLLQTVGDADNNLIIFSGNRTNTHRITSVVETFKNNNDFSLIVSDNGKIIPENLQHAFHTAN